jgi:hypothetical protein
MTVLLIIVSLLLAVALFIAGAIWRGRTTARSAATDSRESVVPGKAGCSRSRGLEKTPGSLVVGRHTKKADRISLMTVTE